ncbi:MAG TPA: Rieske 2Fe-2S domain-containing protein [Chloroflexota bacterium]|nr:Rieske 2Fe-2S domain-containing protein [Chloroflexota bacterium]
MLNPEENTLLCRVGPGTPMGNLMREYWIPAVRSEELPAPDCAPLRVRLLGEDLVAFRDTAGQVGLVQNACPHRGASLFFGRNEEHGLRCVYHGWKFDCTGNCVDMPNEPAESNFKHKIKLTAYACHERNGIIWAYMGSRATPPPLPDLEANMLAGYSLSTILRECNWMQGLEGELDTVHFAFLHFGHGRLETTPPHTHNYYQVKHQPARFSVLDTEVGVSAGAARPAEEDSTYWRITHMLFPFYAMVPTGVLGYQARFFAYVPMDDEHTLNWECYGQLPGEEASEELLREANSSRTRSGLPPQAGCLPNSTDWYGRYRLQENATNDYQIDRGAQRRNEIYTGIKNIRTQDVAMTDSMGPILDRTVEHLGTTDALIIRARRRLMAAARALAEHGTIPPGVDQPEAYRARSGGVVLPRNVDWWQQTEDLRHRFSPAAAG